VSLEEFLKRNNIPVSKIKEHTPSKEELIDKFNLYDRNMKDYAKGKKAEQSEDALAAFLYNSAITLCSIATRASGYRVPSGEHHKNIIKLLTFVMGEEYKGFSLYLERMRAAAQSARYDVPGISSMSQVLEFEKEVKNFRTKVEEWLYVNHTELMEDRENSLEIDLD